MPVIYVYGNHEAYGLIFEDFEIDLRQASQKATDIHFLDAGQMIFQGVRFLGATLWTDFRLFGDSVFEKNQAMYDAQQMMNDYRRIHLVSSPFGRLRPRDTAAMHEEQRAWLEEQLSIPFDGKTVVVTHMAPSAKSVLPVYRNDALTPAYASHLDTLVEQADLWVHGHMHASSDYKIGKCRVVCNPRGYPTRSGAENATFDPDLVIEI
jgi:Icc-related predicted phosphoesterase